LTIFNPAEDRRNPMLQACLLSREWRILAGWVGAGHLTLATEIIAMAMTTMDKGLTASPGIHIPISSAWERKRPEHRGFIGNSNRIQISGCLR
jgi:hypothetical protein